MVRLRNFVAAALVASSTLVALTPLSAQAAETTVEFEGAGWGHGVGMSQYGSFEMAKGGRTAEQILAHYFTGSSTADFRQKLTGWLVDDAEPLWIHMITIPGQLRIEASAPGLSICQQEPDGVGTLSLAKNGSAVSPWVQLLEEQLLELGFDPGPVDGLFTAQTDTAARSFQRAHGLTVDGLVGNQTKNALWDWDGSDRCVLRTPISSFALVSPLSGGAECMVTGASFAAGCTGSVRDATAENRVRLPQRTVRNGTGMELAHGTLRIRPDLDKTTSAFQGLHGIVEIGIDEYVLGIDETILSWGSNGGMEALKAQAIASRSYALATARPRGSEPSFSPSVRDSCWCHLWSTTSSQVYGGWYAETTFGAMWRTAATQTAGRIVTHSDAAVVQAFFGSSSGGRTESNSAAWGSAQIAYLQSVEDPWSLGSSNPFRSWVKEVTALDVAQRLGFQELTGVAVVERNPSGTARTVRFTGRNDGVEVGSDRTGSWVATSFGLRSRYFDVAWGDTSAVGAPPPTSPPPDYAFADISSSVFVEDITWLFERGLTTGCNPPNNDLYCPDALVSRGEMAVFLERALQLPTSTGDHFDDDNGRFYEEAANRIFEAGITAGCGPRKFCGGDSIPREQMAAFLARAFQLDVTTTDYFVDDAKSQFQAEINRVAQEDITRGCNPPANDRFCPREYVTRGQLAAFLKRALD